MEEMTSKQKEFANKYIDSGNATQSVKDTFKVEDSNYAAVKGSRLIRNDNVKKYLEENADGAASRIVELSKSANNESVKLNANKDILDRAGFKPIDKTDITTRGEKINPIYGGQSFQRHEGDEEIIPAPEENQGG